MSDLPPALAAPSSLQSFDLIESSQSPPPQPSSSAESTSDRSQKLLSRKSSSIKSRSSSSTPPHHQPCCPRRYLLAFLSCIGLIVVNSMRVNLSITVITLLDAEEHEKMGGSGAHVTSNLPRVNWTPPMVGILHSAFYVGFLITQVPGGYICSKIAGTRIFGASIMISCVLNLFLPISIAEMGYVPTCFLRFLQGLAEGVTQPALYSFIREWAPKSERSGLTASCLSGVYAGPIIGFPLDGAVTEYLNWQYSYYIHGIMGVIWFSCWFLVAFEAPEVDPHVSKTELMYILSDRDPTNTKKPKVPWAEILQSAPVWTLVVCHFIRSWMFFLMLTNEPMYLNQFHFSIFENGVFSSVPHIMKVIITFCGGFLADAIMTQGVLSRTWTRKMFAALGFGIESACCYALVFIDNGYVAVAFLTIGIGLSGLAVSGWQVNHLDIAPDFASVLVGFSATIGTLGGILSPIVVGLMTNPPNLENWQRTFILTATLLAIAALTFLLFGTAEVQPWANADECNPLQPNGQSSYSEKSVQREETSKE